MASFILDRAHEAVTEVVRSGDAVIDATIGNGWDTLFLARLVGSDGCVVGFDIQQSAIETTRLRLGEVGLLDRCRLLERSHTDLSGIRQLTGERAPTAVMFNLGYLPGGDKSVTTDSETTVGSLDRMLEILAPGGIVTIVVYRGHPGAEDEYRAVEAWAGRLDRQSFVARTVVDSTGPPHAPVLFLVRKR